MATPQRLLVGLGNPGRTYSGTRHNIGSQVIEALAGTLPEAPRWIKTFKGQAAHVVLDSIPCLLLLPQTFMNLSGESLGMACTFYKIAPPSVIVVHDDLDLPLGDVRVKQGGGHAGHNGLKSIDAHLGRNYWRVRLGIGRPPGERREESAVSNWVLGHFTQEETTRMKPLCTLVARAFHCLVRDPPDVLAFRHALSTAQKSDRLDCSSRSTRSGHGHAQTP